MRRKNGFGYLVLLPAVAALAAVAAPGGGGEKACMKRADQAWEHPKDFLDTETQREYEQRMAWWANDRFGMFIHWGIYSVPEGEWNGKDNYAEWILNHAHIPVKTYEKFAGRFNPVNFNADEWVAAAKGAGMKYIVITSKHHDGFCMFDSAFTDYDIVDATPFKRDVLAELKKACDEQGITLCFYYSIMDWHHPDYLPRRKWEKRPADGADYDRYVDYMRHQLAELVCKYNPPLIWFDGEWEPTWNHEYGQHLYNYLRTLNPSLIINNRIDKGRSGMEGMNDRRESAGDFGTPEQQIPATGMPKGYYWETCMTMNRHWGWNKNDKDFKSAEDLVRKLVDINSKGGNFLLNIGPRPDGTFPPESLERLKRIGQWMKVNGESIYGTSASLFDPVDWGRTTTKGNTIYLHVFDWPPDGKIRLPGLMSLPADARLLATGAKIQAQATDTGLDLTLPGQAPDAIDSVVKLTFAAPPQVVRAPEISASARRFADACKVEIDTGDLEVRYTLDGSMPGASSPLYTRPFRLAKSATLKARHFKNGRGIGAVASESFVKLNMHPAVQAQNTRSGLAYRLYEGSWDNLPDFGQLKPAASGTCEGLSATAPAGNRKDNYGLVFTGFLRVPETGLYECALTSDDGSRLFIDGDQVVDNDGLHMAAPKKGKIVLEKGLHALRVEYFEAGGDEALSLSLKTPSGKTIEATPERLFHQP